MAERAHSPEMVEQVGHARDLIIEAIERHESENHDGHPCSVERIGMLAYIAHSMGMRADRFMLPGVMEDFVVEFELQLRGYDEAHEAKEGD